MKNLYSALFALPCAACLLSAALPAHADITSATVYLNAPDPTNAGDSANYASSLAHASFNIGSTGISFETNNSDATSIATFLNNPTFFNAANGFSSSAITDNSELVITGTTYLNAGANSFVVGHDDGVVLTIPGVGYTLNEGGPTGFVSTPFTVNNPDAAGLYAFTLDYSECCGGPADLVFAVNGAPVGTATTPEPSSLLLMGTGLLGVGGVIKRRFA